MSQLQFVSIRFLTSISGPGMCLAEGDEESFPIEDARRFVKSGAAEPADEASAAALAPPAEPASEDEAEEEAEAEEEPEAEAKPKAGKKA